MSTLYTAARSLRTPELVIICGCLIALVTFGLRSSFGLFLEPLSMTRGWGREVFALAIAVQNLLWGLGQPFAGAVADRYGAGRVLAVGGLLYAAGVVLMSVSSTPMMLHLSGGVLVGLGLSGASFTVVLAAMGRIVPEEKRSWALGIGTAAGSLGQFIFAPLGQAFIAAYEWQTALVLMAGFVALVPLLATPLAGRAPEHDIAGTPAAQSLREALQEAFGHGSYLLLVAGFFVCGFHVAFITTHLPPYLGDLGISADLAAWAIGLVGLFNVVGAYSAGVLGGRFSKKYLLSAIYMARAIAIAVFISLPASPASVLVFAATIGLLWLSTVPLTSGLVAVMFGTRFMGTLFGFVFFSHQVGAFLGVWLGGLLYEGTGSYQVVWWLSVLLGVVSAAIHWPIRERGVPRLAEATT